MSIEEQMREAIRTRFTRESMRCPSLKAMGAFIEERLGFDVEIRESWTSTDRPMGRLRHPGKGRRGNKIRVYEAGHTYTSQPIFTHDSSETYRHNTEVAEWILARLADKTVASEPSDHKTGQQD